MLTSDNFQDLLARHPPEESQILHLLHREAVLEKFGTINKNNGNGYPETVKKMRKLMQREIKLISTIYYLGEIDIFGCESSPISRNVRSLVS